MAVIYIRAGYEHTNDINNNTLGMRGRKNNELRPDQPRSKNFLDRTIHEPLCSRLIDGGQRKYTKFRGAESDATAVAKVPLLFR